jgi:hypothetical protein
VATDAIILEKAEQTRMVDADKDALFSMSWAERVSAVSYMSKQETRKTLPAHVFAFSYNGNWTATCTTPNRDGRRPL